MGSCQFGQQARDLAALREREADIIFARRLVVGRIDSAPKRTKGSRLCN
jgi:hypothetical protein